MVANFELELIGAARSYVGCEAVFHQNFAGNCFENPQDERCYSDGLGPKRFDCSGLVIASFLRVFGKGPTTRHVRDFWRAATEGTQGLRTSTPDLGALLVTTRRYTIGGQDQTVPGHVSMISGRSEAGLHVVHANPQAGRVEEIIVRDTSILGCISLAGVMEGRPDNTSVRC